MDTVTLCRLACSDAQIRKTFGGVHASDSLPLLKKHFSTFIVNLDPRSLPGSHWIAIKFNRNKAHYFDSFGLPPTNGNILRFLKRNSNSICFNEQCFQEKYTTTCGKFCLYFLFRSVRFLNLDDLDVENKRKNEIFITSFVRHHFKRGNCCHFNYKKKQKCLARINMQNTHKH